jgi:hypothetical protein
VVAALSRGGQHVAKGLRPGGRAAVLVAGQWTGTVVITDADGPDAAVPLSFDVE